MNWLPVAQMSPQSKLLIMLAITAVAKCMPPPGSALNWRTFYEWFFDSVHQYFNTTPRPLFPDSQEHPGNPKP